MPTPSFVERVRLELIRKLTKAPGDVPTPSSRPPDLPCPAPIRWQPADTMAFVDYENLFHVLRDAYGVNPNAVHLPNYVRNIAVSHGLNLTHQHYFCGLPNKFHDQVSYQYRRRRIAWLESEGALVTALPLHRADELGAPVYREKGVDVSMTSHMLHQVANGLQNVILVSNDTDIAASVPVAQAIAAERARPLQIYSIAHHVGTEDRRVGTRPLRGTLTLSTGRSLVLRHLSSSHQITSAST